MALEKEGEPVAGRHEDVAEGSGSSLMSGFLGAMDPNEENNVKAEAKSVIEQGRSKRQKVDHGLFFENPNGLKDMIKTFPKIRFRGKGNEFSDLDLLLKHYQKWAKALYPQGDNFEDLIYKARSVLSEKEKDKEGHVSDPKRQLHMFRHTYKSSSASLSTSLDIDNEWKFHTPSGDLPDDVRQRIEQNRQRALQRKREREAPAMLPEPEPEAFEDLFGPMLGHDEDEDDPFGHGGGLLSLDVQQRGPSAPVAPTCAVGKEEGKAATTTLTSEQKQRIDENRQKALAKRQCTAASESTGRMDRASDVASNEVAVAAERDIASGKVPVARGVGSLDVDDECFWGATEAVATEVEEEDVFGFGGGLD